MPINPGYTPEPNKPIRLSNIRTVIIQDNYLFDNTVTSYAWYGDRYHTLLSDDTVAIFYIKPKKQIHE